MPLRTAAWHPHQRWRDHIRNQRRRQVPNDQGRCDHSTDVDRDADRVAHSRLCRGHLDTHGRHLFAPKSVFDRRHAPTSNDQLRRRYCQPNDRLTSLSSGVDRRARQTCFDTDLAFCRPLTIITTVVDQGSNRYHSLLLDMPSTPSPLTTRRTRLVAG